MSSTPLEVLSRLNLHPAEGQEDVWTPTRAHVDGLHSKVIQGLDRLLIHLRDTDAGNPQGLVIQGPKGVGKTHLVRYARERVEDLNGYFVLVRLRPGRDFWRDALDGILDSLDRRRQLERLLERLALHARVPAATKTAICSADAPTKQALDRFTIGLREHDRAVGTQSSDVARALALLVSTGDPTAQDAGRAYFTQTSGYEDELTRWGIRSRPDSPQILLHQVSLLMALTGPTLFAVDQIDPLLALSQRTSGQGPRRRGDSRHEQIIDQVAHGLMELREESRRSVTVVACLPATWEELRTHAIDTAEDRFVAVSSLKPLPSRDVAYELVVRRLSDHYEAEGFEPPHPSWPVAPEAFARADRYTPRALLLEIDRHLRSCLERQEITELGELPRTSIRDDELSSSRSSRAEEGTARATTNGTAGGSGGEPIALMDHRWQDLLASAGPGPAGDQHAEDGVLTTLLGAGLTALARERLPQGTDWTVDRGHGARPRIHARLRVVVSEETEAEVHWSFRGIAAEHHRAVQTRIREAVEESELATRDSSRALVLLRGTPWPTGPKTTELVTRFRADGGQELRLTEDDARGLTALEALLREDPPHLDAWLRRTRPASGLGLFRKVFGDGPIASPPELPGPAARTTARTTTCLGTAADRTVGGPSAGPSPPATVTVGVILRDGRPFDVPLELLRKHVLVVAGSGAGKTVLLKRLVEAVALRGVSSVVLDPNNDLSRLGRPWPHRPEGWLDGDQARADAYFSGTEVVIWTPRRTAGRPLSFEPLPDLTAAAEDPDEFGIAVETAVSVLAPRAKVSGGTQKAMVARAVLTQALEFYGRRGGRGLDALIDLLADLPDAASTFDDGYGLARSMATALRAAQVTDPLFAGSGGYTDPVELITPSPGRRARISVVSFVGLPGIDQRQSFVSQLELALFTCMRRRPTQEALGALLVMDEAQDFAPAQGTTPSTASTLRLAAQARKFGLGLAFATQAPRSLHNGVAGNTATQFVGRLTHPTQIEAVAELARRRGADVPDVARLDRGQFYAATEGTTMRKIAVPLSLSHHPAGPPSEDEVLQLAQTGPDAATSRR